jgi:uncharacterized hydrophobic protein (TIGR00271 family)
MSKNIYLVYGAESLDIKDEVIKIDSSINAVEIEKFLRDETLTNSNHVIICADIDGIKKVFKKAQLDDFSIAILPRKNQNTLRATFEIPAKLEDALKVALESSPKPLDLLYTDDEVVLWGALIGDAPPLTYKSASYVAENSFKERYKLLIEAFKKFKSLKQTKIKLITEKEQEINTAATGVVIIEHDNHTCASSLVKDALSLSDSKLSALLVSPTSIVDYLQYLYISIFKRSTKKSLPKSVGFIKSESLYIETTPPLKVMIDAKDAGVTPIKFEVKEKAVRFSASEEFWEKSKEGTSDKETIKLSSLPTTSEDVNYAQETLPLFTHAGEDKYRELFASLREQGRVESTFVVMMVLSTILATVGLFLNSSSVVIGAMLIAPLMQPIVSGSMGVLRSDQSLMKTSFKTVGVGIALVLLTSSLIALILPFHNVTNEIAGRLHPSLLDLIVALASGMAAAYAKNNEKIVGSLAGVSIAVALVPPISTAGIGLGWMNFGMFYHAFLLFLTNFVGIIFAAALTFLVMGFSPIKRAKKGLSYALIVAAIVSIPLYFSFTSMVVDSNIRATLEQSAYTLDGKNIKIENVTIEHGNTLSVKCDFLTPRLLKQSELNRLKKKLESDIGEEFKLEAMQRILF